MTTSQRLATDPDLGQVPDSVLAERYEVSVWLVSKVRRALGVRSWTTRRQETLRSLAFATASDDAIGFEAGVDRKTVGRLTDRRLTWKRPGVWQKACRAMGIKGY